MFSNASSNDPPPWPDQLADKKPGQINAFFRWKAVSDTAQGVELNLFLIKPADLKTAFAIPDQATADVTLRRIQNLRIPPGAAVLWSYGSTQGETQADATGHVTLPNLKIASTPTPLSVKLAK